MYRAVKKSGADAKDSPAAASLAVSVEQAQNQNDKQQGNGKEKEKADKAAAPDVVAAAAAAGLAQVKTFGFARAAGKSVITRKQSWITAPCPINDERRLFCVVCTCCGGADV